MAGQIQVLLADNIPNLGAEADIVYVKRGFARNYLFPSGKAYELNPAALRQVERLKKIRAEREAAERKDAEQVAAKLNDVSLNMELLTGEQGKAFGSITSINIFEQLKKELGEDNVPFDRHALQLEHPIKTSGTHEITVKIYGDVTATIHVNVKAMGASGQEIKPAATPAAEEPAATEEEAAETAES